MAGDYCVRIASRFGTLAMFIGLNERRISEIAWGYLLLASDSGSVRGPEFFNARIYATVQLASSL